MNDFNLDKLSPLKSLKLVGLREYFSNLKNLYDNGKMPKVILLSGEKGIGKFTMIFHIINYILTKNTEYQYNLDEFLIDENNKTYKRILLNIDYNFSHIGSDITNSTKIENVRDLKKKFFNSNFNNLPRFTILDDVELMNANSANALLKLIEEPSLNNYFILINNKKHKLLETLSSRSVEFKIFLNTDVKERIFKSLKNFYQLNDKFIDRYISFTSPGMLLRFSEIINILEINEINSFENNVLKIIESYKKNKNALYLDFIYLLIDIRFSKINTQNIENFLEISETKTKLINLIDQYAKLNLNSNNVYNQFKTYLGNVR